MRRLLGLLCSALAATLLLALSAGQAFGATVHCGDTITQDTTLDTDLLGCPGAALSVQGTGHDVTLNLDGHSVEGALTQEGGSQFAITVLGKTGQDYLALLGLLVVATQEIATDQMKAAWLRIV